MLSPSLWQFREGFNMRIDLMALILVSIALTPSTYAKDYKIDDNESLKIDLSNGKVIVNGKLLHTFKEGEPISVSVNGGIVKIGEDSNSSKSKDDKEFFDGDKFFK